MLAPIDVASTCGEHFAGTRPQRIRASDMLLSPSESGEGYKFIHVILALRKIG